MKDAAAEGFYAQNMVRLESTCVALHKSIPGPWLVDVRATSRKDRYRLDMVVVGKQFLHVCLLWLSG